jgi:hypothetical protein
MFSLLKLAFFATIAAAVAAKLLLESKGSADTDEIDLVNIFGGENLVSTADPFYGGKITTVFGGTILDLRQATPAPTGVFLDVLVVTGGLDLIVPDGWGVVFDGSVIAGGFDDETVPVDDPDAPQLRIGGVVALGGVRVRSRPSLTVVA